MRSRKRYVIGIDEAGRGASFGSLIVAAVMIEEDRLDELSRLGVRDSKVYGGGEKAREARKRLAIAIQDVAQISSLEITAVYIDSARNRNVSINKLERVHAQLLIRQLSYNVEGEINIVADGESVFGALEDSIPNFQAYDKAEDKFVQVAAASIVAKDRRDASTDALLRKYGTDLDSVGGAGYPNPKTAKFLKEYIDLHGKLPPEVRRTWAWTKRLFKAFV